MAKFLAITGLLLSMIGAVLDFTAGTLVLRMGMRVEPGIQSNSWAWVFFLFGLGAALLITGVIGITKIGMGRMNVFGGLMILYGVIMLLIGWLMLSGMSPMMQGADASGIGMLVVGGGMILNGVLMVSRSKTMSQNNMA